MLQTEQGLLLYKFAPAFTEVKVILSVIILMNFFRFVLPAPGTLLFMPPEALVDPARYDQSLDIFSFGILAVCVVSGYEPSADLIFEPKRADVVNTQGQTIGNRIIPEITRRASDFDRVSDDHPLKEMFVRCIHNDLQRRPTATELHERVKAVAKTAGALVTVR